MIETHKNHTTLSKQIPTRLVSGILFPNGRIGMEPCVGMSSTKKIHAINDVTG
jgi:hypothetical protein